MIYTANDWWSFFSPDAGRQWFRLTPQCEMSQTVGWGAFGVDRGLTATGAHKGGHVVGLGYRWGVGAAPREASGCELPTDMVKVPKEGNPDYEEKQERSCAERAIAWTDDVGPELAESMKATSGDANAWKGKSRTERAGGGGADLGDDDLGSPWAQKAKWRYATIRHLPAPAAIGGSCKVYEGLLTDEAAKAAQATIPGSDCKAAATGRCHGRRAQTKVLTTGVVDRDAWCPDYQTNSCKCTNGPPAVCRYPNPTSLEIDPRNGWAYLSSDAGLLSSPSGGRRWIRQGGAPQSNPADVFKKMIALDTFEADNAVLGAKLLTKQYHCGPTESSPCTSDPAPGNILDLNTVPDRITFVGRVSLAFTPCSTNATYTGSDRLRGHMVATVPVEWLADAGYDAAGQPKYRRVSSIFMAAQRAECDGSKPESPPGALEFWDTAHLELKAAVNAHPDLKDYNLRARTYFDGTKPKLLHYLPSMPGLPLRYTAAAVAPSDPRVLWAFSHGYAVSEMSTVKGHPASTTLSEGPAGHLLWRSLNGGATWHVALPAAGPYAARHLRVGGGIYNMRMPELSIAPDNPHKLLLADISRFASGSGADDAWMVEPVPPAHLLDSGVPPEPNCAKCDNAAACALSCNFANFQSGLLGGCDRQRQSRDVCQNAEGGTLGIDKYTHCFLGAKLQYTPWGANFPNVTNELPICAPLHKDAAGTLKMADDMKFNGTALYCSAIPPASEAAVQASQWNSDPTTSPGVKVLTTQNNQTTSLVYKTTTACVPCDVKGLPTSAGGDTNAPCCVRWTNFSGTEADLATCVSGPLYGEAATQFMTHPLTASRGASGSPDFSSAILLAAYSPLAATSAATMVAGAPAVAVAGDDGDSSVVGLPADPQNPNSGAIAGAWAPDLIAFAQDVVDNKKVLWALSSTAHEVVGPKYPQKADANSAELAKAEPPSLAYDQVKVNYLRVVKINAAHGVTPAAMAAAQTSRPVILPDSTLLETKAYQVPGSNPVTYTKRFTTQARLAGNGDIMDGWSIPRLKVNGDHLVIASPGIGVIAVKKDYLAPSTDDRSLVGYGLAHPIPFPDGAEQRAAGACVADIEVISDDLYAVVAQPAFSEVPSCAAVPPGLYRAKRRGLLRYPCESASPRPEFCKDFAMPYHPFELIVPFLNPHSVEWIPEAASTTGRLVIADWSPAAGVGAASAPYNASGRGGGLWSCPLPGLSVASNDPTRCHMIVQGDGITDVAAFFYPPAVQFSPGLPWQKSGVVFGAKAKYPLSVHDTHWAYMNPSATTTGPATGLFHLDLRTTIPTEGAAPDLGDLASTDQLTKQPSCKLSKVKGKSGVPQCAVLSGEVDGTVVGSARILENLTGISTGDLPSHGVAQSSDGGQGTYWAGICSAVPPTAGQSVPAENGGPFSIVFDPLPGVVAAAETAKEALLSSLKNVQLVKACAAPAAPPSSTTKPVWIIQNDHGMPIRLPIKKLRIDYEQLRLYAESTGQGFMWSADTAGPPIAATPVPNTTNRWTAAATRSATEPDALGWARVSLRLASKPTEEIRWTLNGKPLIGAWNDPDHTLFWSATSAIIEGPNELQAICPAETPNCRVDPPEVVFLRAPVEEPLPAEVGTSDSAPSETANFWFDTRSEVSLRQGVWALVEVADTRRATMARWNGGPWLPLNTAFRVSPLDTSLPPDAPDPAMLRLPVPAEALRYGSNLLELQIAPCLAVDCPPGAGVLSARLVREASDDEDLCLASPEICGNSLDDDCNGQTDDQGAELCDGPDPDGCANGHAACGSAECNADEAQTPLALPTLELSMQVAGIDAYYADGSIVPQQFANPSIHIGRLLSTGATVRDLAMTLPTGTTSMVLQKLVIRGTPVGARLPWPGYEAVGGRPVELRSKPTDNGQDLTLDFGSAGTIVTPGQPIVLLIADRPGTADLRSIYGCNDGRLTFPSSLLTNNGCDFAGVDCTAQSAPGNACDVGPAADPIWGDQDGCKTGYFITPPGQNDLICVGDWPMDADMTWAEHLDLSVQAISYLWRIQPPTYVPLNPAQHLDIRTLLTQGTQMLGATIPQMPGSPPPEEEALIGIRLHLAAPAQLPTAPDGPALPPVELRSGPEGNGVELDLELVTPTAVPSPRPLTVQVAADLQPYWNATYTCGPELATAARRILVRLGP